MADNGENKIENKTENNADKEKNKFNWVTQRAACTLPTVFKTLILQVEEDVKTRNGLRPANSPYEFSVEENGPDFTVILKAKGVQRIVKFTLTEHAILVSDDAGHGMFEVTLTFNDKGECKLNVNKEEHEYWQVRRMALEDLLFHSN